MRARAALNDLPATQDEFEAWCTGPGGPQLGHFEFLHGCIVAEPPANWPHGRIGGAVCARVGAFVEERRLGLFFDSSQGFALPSGDTVEPDVAVILAATWAAAQPPRAQFLRIVPDLVFEVLSPRTAWRDRSVKREIYERNGVREYWLRVLAARPATGRDHRPGSRAAGTVRRLVRRHRRHRRALRAPARLRPAAARRVPLIRRALTSRRDPPAGSAPPSRCAAS
jgi:Uma2 family endonuclease